MTKRGFLPEAVILMAGSGSRLRGSDGTLLKAFVPVLGRPLVSYTMDALVHAGVKNVNFVVGYESERVIARVKQLIPPGLGSTFIENRDWQKQNGISLLAAANQLAGPFLLAMSDHLFDNAVVDLLIESADLGLLNLAVDRKIDSIFDLADAMKVRIAANQVVAIGKNLRDYNAIDVGWFVCPLEVFEYLKRAKRNGDCSLADGVRLMAADNKVHAVDIGDAWWQDVDTPEMLEHAANTLQRLTQGIGRNRGVVETGLTASKPFRQADAHA
jgi:1L-myo-inositol 1-phosphate cytidylyltransferase